MTYKQIKKELKLNKVQRLLFLAGANHYTEQFDLALLMTDKCYDAERYCAIYKRLISLLAQEIIEVDCSDMVHTTYITQALNFITERLNAFDAVHGK